MKFLATFLLVFAIHSTCISQNLKGKVIDAYTREPIENVNVFLINQNVGTFTVFNGTFDLQAKERIKNDELVIFTRMGYITNEISFKTLKENKFLVTLKIDVTHLNEISLIVKGKPYQSLNYEILPSMKRGVYATGSFLDGDKIYVFGGDISINTESFKETLHNNPGLAFYDNNISLQGMLQKVATLSQGSFKGYDNTIQVFNIDNNIWKIEKSQLQKRAYHNVLFDKGQDQVYFVGGKNLSANKKFEYLSDNIEVLNLKNNAILTDNINPHQAVNFGSFFKDGNIVLVGGSIKQNMSGEKVYSDKIHLFNTKTGLWYDLGNMPQAKETSGILVDNTFYLFGGYNQKPLPYIETYDLTSGKWERIGELFEPVSRPSLAYNDHIIYIYFPGNLSLYDLKTGVMKEYAINFDVESPQMLYSNGQLYLLGGYDKGENTVEPSAKVICIDLDNLNNTRVKYSKTIGESI